VLAPLSAALSALLRSRSKAQKTLRKQRRRSSLALRLLRSSSVPNLEEATMSTTISMRSTKAAMFAEIERLRAECADLHAECAALRAQHTAPRAASSKLSSLKELAIKHRTTVRLRNGVAELYEKSTGQWIPV
jgi:hypothetical protein